MILMSSPSHLPSGQRLRSAPTAPLPFRLQPLLLLLMASTVWAQEGPVAPPRPPAQKLDRVETTARPATDIELRRQAPVARQVYGREELDKFGDGSVTEVLKRLPGVSIVGGAPRMRGLGSGYTLVHINGEPAPSGFQLDQLNPAMIERIEVSKSASVDSSAQAVAGVINIILRSAPRIRQRDLQIRTAYNTDRPVVGASLAWGERMVGRLALSLPVSLSQWRTLSETASSTSQLGPDGQPALGAAQVASLNWGHTVSLAPQVTWRMDDRQTLTVQAFANANRWHYAYTAINDIQSGHPINVDDQAGTGRWRMLRMNMSYANRLDDDRKLELKFGGQRGSGQFRNGTFTNGGIDSNDWLRDNFGTNSDRNLTQSGKYSQWLGDSHTVTLGWDLEWRRRQRVATTLLPGGATQQPDFDGQPFEAAINRKAIFLQDEWELSPLVSAVLGVRDECLTTSAGGVASGRSRACVLAPMAHLMTKLDPKGRDLLRLSLTRSYKAPDPVLLMGRLSPSRFYPDLSRPNDALYPDSLGNPQLRPELATGVDLTWEHAVGSGGVISAGVFHRQVTDLMRQRIELRQGLPGAAEARWVSTPENIGKASASGLELEAKGRAGDLMPFAFPAALPLSLRASLSVYRSRVSSVPGPDNRLDNQQPWSATVGADYRFPQVGGMPVTLGATLAHTPAYLTRQATDQSIRQERVTGLDAFVVAQTSASTSVRWAVQNLIVPVSDSVTTRLPQGYFAAQRVTQRRTVSLTLDMRL